MTSTPSDGAMKVFKYLEATIGESSDIIGVGDESEASKVDVMVVRDRPDDGVTSYATLDFSNHDIGLVSGGKQLRVELVMACASGYKHGAHILASCAFAAMNDGVDIEPDEILEGAVALYYPRFTMQHILLVDPFLWNLEAQHLEDRTVTFLQAVPISAAEAVYAEEKGADALQDIFSEKQIDVYDLERASVV